MTHFINTRLLALFCLIFSAGVFSACKKDKQESTAVELLSFGPTGAKHGDTLRFVGNNLDKVTAIELTGATVQQSAFIKQDKEQILIKIPNETVKGLVKLKTPDGDIVSKTMLNLKVAATVASFTPKETRPGTNITITGDYLNWVSRITFARDKTVTGFVSQSKNQIVVTVPVDAQTGPLVLFYTGTDSMAVQTTDTLKVILPVVTGMTPNPVKHADNLTITGTNLDLAKSVTFTGVTAPVTSFVSQSATQIVVKVPGGTKKGKITLTAQSTVTTQSATDLDVLLPAITDLAPNPMDPETDLTITGTNLDLVKSVAFTGVTAPVATFVSQTPTQLVVTTPRGALKGKITLNVLNSTVTVQSSQVLNFNGGLAPLADFPFPIYTDVLENGYQDWSYTGGHDFNSTANVRQGTKSIKATYAGTVGDQYQGITFHHNTGLDISAYTKLEFSVFGEAGTGGKKLNVVTNGDYGNPVQVTIVEGEWTTYTVNISSLANVNPLKEIVLQAAGWAGVLHIDHVGLR